MTSAPTGITCGTDCSEAYFSGTTVTLTATPAAGSLFAGWSGGGCSGAGGCTVLVNANKTVTARFDPIAVGDVSLSVVKAGSGSGTVTSTPAGIACGDDCANAYPAGTVVTLAALADPGSLFAGWSGGGCSGVGGCTVTLTAATTVQATFVVRFQPSLTLTANQASFRAGERLTLSVTVANPGSAGRVDVYFGALLPASAGPAVGCPGGDAVAFLADGFTRVVVTCLSAPPATFPRLVRNTAIPGSLAPTTLPDFFLFDWTPDLPAGTWTFFLVLTPTDVVALGGVITPVAFDTVDVTFTP